MGRSGLALALVCCSPYAVERHQLADGSWQLTCRLPMDECARQADQLCTDQRYRIVHGKSQHVVRGAGPSQVEYRASELTFSCGNPDDAPPGGVAAPLARSAGPVDPAKLVCTPGVTQACVGPAGCPGGQACSPDGAAFGPCDCGPLRAASVAAGPMQKPSSDAGP
jgi:hypothetical protein